MPFVVNVMLNPSNGLVFYTSKSHGTKHRDKAFISSLGTNLILLP